MIDNLNVRYNTSGITNKENLAFKISNLIKKYADAQIEITVK